MTAPAVPFGTESVEEVPLSAAPLVKVVAQLRFEPLLMVERREFVAEFQQALRPRYPALEEQREISLLISSKGMESGPGSDTVWRFLDRAREWEVSLGTNFMSLVTTNYSSRRDFVGRFREALDALKAHVAPSHTARLGVRYVDRISGRHLDRLNVLIRPELLGILQIDDLGSASCEQAITATSFRMDDDVTMDVRWGLLKASQTFDIFITPIEAPSWVLDIDMYSALSADLDPSELAATAGSFAERIYRFFRWATTPEFLAEYGGPRS